MKTPLFPHSFQCIGWIIFAIGVALGAYSIFKGFDGSYTLNNVTIISIIVGGLFATCSREKIEDEMIASLRGETLKAVCYITFFVWVVYRVIMACVSTDMFYIVHDEPFITPFIVWILYYGRFENKLKQLRRASRNFTL